MLFSRMDKAGFAVFHKIAATQGKPFKIYERKGFSQDVKAKEKEKEKEKDDDDSYVRACACVRGFQFSKG